MESNKQLMVGMHETGKTSFLAALFYTVESGEVPDSLQLLTLGEDRTYLVKLADQWLGGSTVERTKLGEEQIVRLALRDTDTEAEMELVLPDVSGETFRDQWEKRVTTKVFDDLARQAKQLLLFIHPDSVKSPVRINLNKEIATEIQADSQAEFYDGGAVGSEVEPVAEKFMFSPNYVDWQASFAPTQVQITEVIQFLSREPDVYPLSKVAIIISAWDLLRDDYSSPSAWLSEELPLFNQFIMANSDNVAFRIFGVSALGGPLSDNNDALLSTYPQTHRIEVVSDAGDTANPHDITAPIKWLMQTNN
jgi:hypothetical protein